MGRGGGICLFYLILLCFRCFLSLDLFFFIKFSANHEELVISITAIKIYKIMTLYHDNDRREYIFRALVKQRIA